MLIYEPALAPKDCNIIHGEGEGEGEGGGGYNVITDGAGDIQEVIRGDSRERHAQDGSDFGDELAIENAGCHIETTIGAQGLVSPAPTHDLIIRCMPSARQFSCL
jgi:hypothetical protein